MKFNFKKLEDPIFTDDFWYDLTDGGYIKPENVLEDESQIKSVREAIGLLNSFESQLRKNGLLDYM